MQTMWELLTDWRRAERQLDGLPVGSPEWQLAVQEVDRAHTAYRAGLAQVTARHREADIPAGRDWWSLIPGAALRSAR